MQAQADAVPSVDIERVGPSERTIRYESIRIRSRPAVTVEYSDLELPITPTPVETERGLVLIDVSPEGIAEALEVYLSDLGYGLEAIWLVTLIHHDGTTSAGPKRSVHAPI
ncbi:hypothetical protein RBH26_19690 [Natronolimnohabitans sp. A-GB9]|uniref:hypothetical protein n=1 Tax=Natronolimnohabitans sp. A-GB9 TaxID=3069757 RepID=UPI0027B18976|nr:hypothetical protein [Natronolimnohabitans sp. A-GB9]MDQ2052682.1 hypothetical protein [Natronolimnohabitans sp. A-GB9]